jgi:hypothetical protein
VDEHDERDVREASRPIAQIAPSRLNATVHTRVVAAITP